MTKQQYMLFRSLTSLIFIYAGIKHLLHPIGVFNRIAASTAYTYMPYASFFKGAILLSGIIMLIGGIALLVGYKAGNAAVFLLAMLIPITLTVQLENLNDLGPFFKNIAISGSLIFIIKQKTYDKEKRLVRFRYNAL